MLQRLIGMENIQQQFEPGISKERCCLKKTVTSDKKETCQGIGELAAKNQPAELVAESRQLLSSWRKSRYLLVKL